VALDTAAGGCALVAGGGAVDALAPELLADAFVVEPAEGLDTLAVDGDVTLGLAALDVDAPPPGGFTFTVTGALTCGLVFAGGGGT
jgi:hypothetical protein